MDDEATANDEKSLKKPTKKKKKKSKLRRSQRIKTIETKKTIEKEIEFAQRLQTYSQNQIDTNGDDQACTDGAQPSDELSLQTNTNITSPKPYKKMLLTKAFNDDDFAYIVHKSEWPKFDHLEENLFLKKTKITVNKATKRMVCDCSTSEQERALGIQACRDDCLNRMLMIEWFAFFI
jgi:hypothetical protein